MLNFEKLIEFDGRASTIPIAINPINVVSISPARRHLKEVNGQKVDNLPLVEIHYSLGSEVKKVFVIAEYSELINKIQNKRNILHG